MENHNKSEMRVNILKEKLPRTVSVAPMLDITNKHFRRMMRLITRESLLYTEMINHDAVLFGERDRILRFDEIEKPLVIQLGGSNPDRLAEVAEICKAYNYDEVNLNCGCPSSKVQQGHFGACLMRCPEDVAECTRKMKLSGLDVTVKCRLGLNNFDQNFLDNFIDIVNKQGQVKHFIIHARLALMNLDTDKNRKIPPLQYSTVFSLKKTFPDTNFTLNGGIKTLDEVESLFNEDESLNGCMLGRAAYETPWIFADVDRRFYGKCNPGKSRKEIVYEYADYCEQEEMKGELPHVLLKPLTHLFAGEKKNNFFKNLLYSLKKNETDLCDHLKTVVTEYEKINPEAVNYIYEKK